jgi:hypothetical protein
MQAVIEEMGPDGQPTGARFIIPDTPVPMVRLELPAAVRYGPPPADAPLLVKYNWALRESRVHNQLLVAADPAMWDVLGELAAAVDELRGSRG